ETVQREELRLVDDYDKCTHDAKELREAAHELLLASRNDALGMPASLTRPQMFVAGTKLMERGSNDPLVVAITMYMRPILANDAETAKLCAQAIDDAIKNYPPRQQIDVIERCQKVQLALYNKNRRDKTYI